MTEDEAKTKWCPFSRTNGSGRESAGGPLAGEHPCIASACMAWRWSEEKRTAAFIKACVEHMKETGDNYNKAIQEVIKRRDEFAHTDGFCGLAGAPQ